MIGSNPTHSPSIIGYHRSFVAVTLLLILTTFFAIRLPLAISNNGEVDEDWFTVPGWTVLQEGLPRIPYAPDRDLKGVFYRADELLYSIPPAFFYYEAVFFAIFPPGYATARLASMVAGAVTLVCVYWLGKQLFRDVRIGLLAAALYSISRVFYFPATTVRPDMLCSMFGAFAILSIIQWSKECQLRWLIVSGLCCGMGVLTHPFALVFCLQCGVWVLLRQREDVHYRFQSAAALAFYAALALIPWAALILVDTELFKIQFSNNILSRTQTGLAQRFVMFWEPLMYHLEFLNYRTLVPQSLLMFGGLLASTIISLFDFKQCRSHLYFAWTSIYFLIALQGKHPTMGYWAYPAIFIFLAVAHSVIFVFDRIPKGIPSIAVRLLTVFCLTVVMFLGSGVRALWTTLNHWQEPSYNSRVMNQYLLEKYPKDARYLVDRSYVFDFYLAGRDTLLGLNDRGFFEAKGLPYDYLIINPTESRQELPKELNAILIEQLGNREFVAAEVYEHEKPKLVRPKQ